MGELNLTVDENRIAALRDGIFNAYDRALFAIEAAGIDLTDDEWDRLGEAFTGLDEYLRKAACETLGHKWVDDKCGQHALHYCVYCDAAI